MVDIAYCTSNLVLQSPHAQGPQVLHSTQIQRLLPEDGMAHPYSQTGQVIFAHSWAVSSSMFDYTVLH